EIAIGPPPADPASGHPIAALILVTLLSLIYFAAFWASPMAATPAQKLFSLTVIEHVTRGRISLLRAVIRCLALWVGLILLFGVLMVAFTERKRGFHDFVAGTTVIKATEKH
ncbi:MAG: hypothetical protein QOI34_1165, partial [Verrucomicrobiota bacterium]